MDTPTITISNLVDLRTLLATLKKSSIVDIDDERAIETLEFTIGEALKEFAN